MLAPLLGLLLACWGQNAYIVEGTVVRLEGERVILDHEEVAGLMPAMTMPFDVADPAMLKDLRPGDQVYARYEIEEGKGGSLTKLRVTGHGPPPAQRGAMPLERNHQLPGHDLPSHRGDTVRIGQGQGETTILTFIYTRCPLPEACPAVMMKLRSVEAALDEAGVPARLVAVSLDPDFDTQEVLAAYASAQDLEKRVADILSQKGTVSVDRRTNTLIIKDVEEHVLAAEDLVRRLDTQTPQVLIEARIVEASSNFSEDIGIQWGGNYTASPAFGNETGLVFPAIVGISGAADDPTSPTTGLLSSNPRFAVNLPAAVGAGSGGGIGLSLGSLSGAGNLNLRLGAAEERGTVKIISSPRVATLDNTEASISQGISIPISVVSSLGVNTQFFNAQLQLRVKPNVTQDGNVNLKVDISKNEPNFSQTGANGNPTIERKEAQTQLLVRDGDTAVIGFNNLHPPF